MDRSERLFQVLLGIVLTAGGLALLIFVMPTWLAEALLAVSLLGAGLALVKSGLVR